MKQPFKPLELKNKKKTYDTGSDSSSIEPYGMEPKPVTNYKEPPISQYDNSSSWKPKKKDNN